MAIALRPARPGDVPLVARVLEMSGRGHLARGAWDVLFPEPAEREVALLEVAGGVPSWCHHRVFHVAEHDGEAGAALACFEPAAIGGTSLAEPLGRAFAALGVSRERASAALAPLAAYLRCFPEMPAGTWIVENVGALPSHRRRGLVAALLERALEEGTRRGVPRAQISCLIGNEPARRAYERAGFEVVESLEDPAFEALLGVPGFVRMARPL
ncbi:MAG TPA: GNAT family N-acetyltransferase [Myxococcota bacterium]|nr:GNAT family N-acetyltransferase [Myxococcota bacterium]